MESVRPGSPGAVFGLQPSGDLRGPRSSVPLGRSGVAPPAADRVRKLASSHRLVVPPVLLSFSPSVLLSFSPPVLLSFSPPVLLSFSPPVLLSSSPSVLLSFSPSLLLSFCPSVLLSFSPPVLLSFCPAAPRPSPDGGRSDGEAEVAAEPAGATPGGPAPHGETRPLPPGATEGGSDLRLPV